MHIRRHKDRGGKKRARRGATLVILVLWPGLAYGWGSTGHRVVGQIAENHLSQEAATEVRALLGHESLARASTWADEIRSDPAWRHAAPWHFVTIEDGETYDTSTKNPRGDVVEAIERFAATLQDATAEKQQRVEALRWLVHLVGDLHQPLHVGRGADAGGNGTTVLWFGEPSNLHVVWDSEMIDATRLSFSELARFLDHPTPQEITAWQGSPVRVWVEESQAVRTQVYDLGDRRLGFEYSSANLPLVERRLLQAGVRLAGLLGSIFAPP